MKRRALCGIFVILFLGFLVVFAFPQRTTADSAFDAKVQVLDTRDTNQYNWIANGQPWFNPSQIIVPSRVVINRLGIDAKVKKGGYDKKTDDWKISDDAAYFSPQLNKNEVKANSIFIYGHNSEQIFGKTDNLQPGDELMIKLDSGPWVKYRFKTDEVVNPSDVTALNHNSTELTLLACYGLNSEHRHIMHFVLEK